MRVVKYNRHIFFGHGVFRFGNFVEDGDVDILSEQSHADAAVCSFMDRKAYLKMSNNSQCDELCIEDIF